MQSFPFSGKNAGGMHHHSKILLGFYVYKARCKSVKYPFNTLLLSPVTLHAGDTLALEHSLAEGQADVVVKEDTGDNTGCNGDFPTEHPDFKKVHVRLYIYIVLKITKNEFRRQIMISLYETTDVRSVL